MGAFSSAGFSTTVGRRMAGAVGKSSTRRIPRAPVRQVLERPGRSVPPLARPRRRRPCAAGHFGDSLSGPAHAAEGAANA